MSTGQWKYQVRLYQPKPLALRVIENIWLDDHSLLLDDTPCIVTVLEKGIQFWNVEVTLRPGWTWSRKTQPGQEWCAESLVSHYVFPFKIAFWNGKAAEEHLDFCERIQRCDWECPLHTREAEVSQMTD